MTRIIPITAIWLRYLALRKMSQEQRLAEARRLVDHPEELATEFAESVARFSSYANLKDPFYPPRRPRTWSDRIQRTNDVVLRLEAQNGLKPADAPNRVTKHGAGAAVTAVPASRLASDYVARELLVHRTTSPAMWEDGSRNVGGLRLDVLLADSEDATPIVGEVKLPGDTDSFFALVQALACAAHLVTVNQYERMRLHLKAVELPELATDPRVDVWVLSVTPPGSEPGQPRRGKYLADLQSATEALAPLLMAQDGIRRSVRRIADLGVSLDPSGALASEVCWAWGQSGE